MWLFSGKILPLQLEYVLWIATVLCVDLSLLYITASSGSNLGHNTHWAGTLYFHVLYDVRQILFTQQMLNANNN